MLFCTTASTDHKKSKQDEEREAASLVNGIGTDDESGRYLLEIHLCVDVAVVFEYGIGI